VKGEKSTRSLVKNERGTSCSGWWKKTISGEKTVPLVSKMISALAVEAEEFGTQERLPDSEMRREKKRHCGRKSREMVLPPRGGED